MEIMAEFILCAENFPLDEVYDIIGLSGEKGKLEKKAFKNIAGEDYIRNKECSIKYATECIKTIDTTIPIQRLFSLLHPRESQIIKCIREFDLYSKFCIVINLTDNPIVALPINFIDMASRFKAEIEFDTYVRYNRLGKIVKPWSWFNLKKIKSY